MLFIIWVILEGKFRTRKKNFSIGLMTRNFLAQALDSRLAGKWASKMSKNLVIVDILPLRPLLRQLHSRTTKFRRLAKCFKNTKMQVRKAPRKLGKQTKKQTGKQQEPRKQTKNVAFHCWAKSFLFSHIRWPKSKNYNRNMQLICDFLYISISNVASKSAQSAGKLWQELAKK